MIYLDNAATTLQKPPQVAEAVIRAMASMGNSSRGTYGAALQAARGIYGARELAAELFGCPRADHVAFTSNSTEALNTAINGLIGSGDHVISTDLEHNSVLRPLYRLEAEHGTELSFVPADRNGCIDYGAFEDMLKPNTRAIVCTHASNLTGNMLDIGRIGAFAHENGLLFIVDASQTAGNTPIDMSEMNIDVLCFTGHKGLMGPQGTGGLCVMPGVEIRPLKVGGTGIQSFSRFQPEDMPARLEAGTANGHGIAGLSAAMEFILSTGAEGIHAKELELMQRFYRGVSGVEGVTVYGDFGGDRAAIVALNIDGYDSAAAADELAENYGIAVRPGAHCAPRMHRALGTQDTGAVRFSFGYYNTAEEADTAAAAVREMAQ